MATPDTRQKLNQTVIFAPTVGTTFSVYQGVGSNTPIIRFLNFSASGANKIAIVPDGEILIIEFDGQILDYPLKIHKNNTKYIDKKIFNGFSFFKIYTLVANTTIRIIGVGY